MKQKSLPWIAAGILGLALYSVARTQPRASIDSPSSPPPSSDFEHRVAATGLIEPKSENIQIGAHLSGVVKRVFVHVGQDVRAGDPLVELDLRALEAARAQRIAEVRLREADVVTAEARARKAVSMLADIRRHLKFAEGVSDLRSISAEELSRRRSAVETGEAELAAALAEVESGRASILSANAALSVVETDLQRSRITAPMDGRVLQVRIRPGEFAQAGPTATPWMILGDVSELHVRVDIDEHEAWRVQAGASAIAQVRGNSALRTNARFVRFEPLVIPKQSLSGSSTERVDTRVLQAVFCLESNQLTLFVGQQMDVFIQAAEIKNIVAQNKVAP